MGNMIAIMRKELRTYFVSPVAYVVIAAYLLMCGIFFAILLTAPTGAAESRLDIVFGNVPVVLLIVAPALTMRLLAEEQKSGTIELLLTSPVRDWEVVVGKYLSSLVLYAIPVVVTMIYIVILKRYSSPDLGPMLGGFLGIFLLGAAFLAVGMLATALTQNQVVAALISIAVLLALWLINAFASAVQAPLSSVLQYLSIISHYSEFYSGVIDTRHVVYYLSVIVVSLFLSVRVLETRRWT